MMEVSEINQPVKRFLYGFLIDIQIDPSVPSMAANSSVSAEYMCFSAD